MSSENPGGSKDCPYTKQVQNKIKNKIKDIVQSSKAPFQKLKSNWCDHEEKVPQHSKCIIVWGPKCSGKSTIINQLIWHNNKLCDETKKSFVVQIRRYLLEIIFSLVDAMLKSTPTMTFENPENENKFNYLKSFSYEFGQFHEYIESIWLDKNIQEVSKRKAGLQLQENASYFLDRINDIKQCDYFPTDEDLLHYYMPTERTSEYHFMLDYSSVHITEIVNQDKTCFKKWAKSFDCVKNIIFVTACDSYNIMSNTDTTKNKLQESMDLFVSITSFSWLHRKDIILFLNKQDLLEKKLLEGRFKFEDYFENYKTYCCPLFQNLSSSSNVESEVFKVKHFIKDEFLRIAETHNPEAMEADYIYTHFSSAVKTNKEFNDIVQCTVDVINRCYGCTVGLM